MTYIAPPAPTFEEVQAGRRIIRNRVRGWRQGRYLSEPRSFHANLKNKYRFGWTAEFKLRERMPYSWQEAMERRDEPKTGLRRPHDPWKQIKSKRIGYGPFMKHEYRATWDTNFYRCGRKRDYRLWDHYQGLTRGGGRGFPKRKAKARSFWLPHKYKVHARPGRYERAVEYRRKFETGELWRDIEAKLPPGSRYYIGHPD